MGEIIKFPQQPIQRFHATCTCADCGNVINKNSGLRQVYRVSGRGLCPECTMSAGDMAMSPSKYLKYLTS